MGGYRMNVASSPARQIIEVSKLISAAQHASRNPEMSHDEWRMLRAKLDAAQTSLAKVLDLLAKGS